MLWAVSPLDFIICCFKICEPPHCLHVDIFVNPGITIGIVRACQDKNCHRWQWGHIFVPLIYLWVNWPQQLYSLSVTDMDQRSQTFCIFFFYYYSPWLQCSCHEGDELFVEHNDVRAQFLQQIVHTFDNILSNKKWDGIIVCGGIIVWIVNIIEGGGGKIKNIHYCTSTIK